MTVYEYDHYEDAEGRQVVSCWRSGSGICGYGRTEREAFDDFHDKEEALLPLPKVRRIDCGPFEPPEYVTVYEDYDDER